MCNKSGGWAAIRLPEGPKRKHLVIVAAGDDSCHRRWEQNLPDKDRSWDLMSIQWGPNPPAEEDADIVIRTPGYKYNLIFRLMQDIPWLQEYDYVWLTDDDIATSWSDIQRIFEIAETYGLELAQPGLTANSEATHDICYARPDYLLRYTSFVEVMAPVFSRHALKTCLPSFAKSPVGGLELDWIWPKLLGHPTHQIAIIDAVAVHHTRPLGTSKMWDSIRGEGDAYTRKTTSLLAEYGISSASCRYYEYGYILNKPAEAFLANRLQSAGDDHQLKGRLMPLLHAAVSRPVSKAWMEKPLLWHMPESWTGGQPKVFRIPELTEDDWSLSIGFTMRISAEDLDAQPKNLLFLGTPRQKPRMILLAARENGSTFSLTIEFPGKRKQNLSFRLTNLPYEVDLRLCLQAYPVAGWLRIWINETLLKDLWGSPISWAGATALLVGQPDFEAVVCDLWLSPVPVDEVEKRSLFTPTQAEAAE